MATTQPAPLPTTMNAVRIAEYGDSSKLRFESAPVPQIEREHILVGIRFAAVNPVDWKIREGHMKQADAEFPLTLGQDFAGELVDHGTCATSFRPGERLFGFANGAYAEYAATQLSWVAAIPEKMSFEIAAALPTAGLTALQLVRDVAKAKPGDRILIHGAAGGVGSFATQIAKAWGARVIGTASGDDVIYLRSLGNVEAIDYTRERFEDKARNVDAVLDLIGGETLARSYGLVKKGGVIATIAGTIDKDAVRRAEISGVRLGMKRNSKDLAELAALVEQGRVKPRMGEVFALAQAREAQEMSQTGHAKGKILLKV